MWRQCRVSGRWWILQSCLGQCLTIEHSRKNLETCHCRGRQSMYPSGFVFLIRRATDNYDQISLIQNYNLSLFGLCSLIRLQQSSFFGVLLYGQLWFATVVVSLSLLISNISHTKIFVTLCHHQSQVQDQFQQPNQSNQLQIARYRKAVSTALWLQFELVACCIPYMW